MERPRDRDRDRDRDPGRSGHGHGPGPFPTPPRKRTPDMGQLDTPGGGSVGGSGGRNTHSRDNKDKKKWSLGGALGGALGGSLGGLFRRRRKSDSSSSLEEEELETPPSARKNNSHSFLKKRRDSANSSKRKTRTNARVSGAFDHVVVTPLALTQPYILGSGTPTKADPNANGGYFGNGVLVDNHFGGSFPKALNLQQDRNREWVSPGTHPQAGPHPQAPTRHRRQDSKGSSVGSGSLDGIIRRGRRDLAMARAEELRKQIRGSSSEGEVDGEGDGSLHSNSSSLSRFRSDDSLGLGGHLKGGKDSLSRKSRAARTERYLKRLSRDEDSIAHLAQLENHHPNQHHPRRDAPGTPGTPGTPNQKNRWAAKVVYTESSDYDTKVTVKALSTNSSPVTSPPSRPKNAAHQKNPAPVSTGTFPPPSSYGHPASPGVPRSRAPPEQPPRSPVSTDPRLDPANIAGLPTHPARLQHQHHPVNGRSISYDCNINVAARGVPVHNDVMVVQFPVARVQSLSRPVESVPLGGLGLARGGSVSPSRFSAFTKQAPPPPPPRDPQRRFLNPQQDQLQPQPQHQVGRPMSYAFEAGGGTHPTGVSSSRHSLNQQHYPDQGPQGPQGLSQQQLQQLQYQQRMQQLHQMQYQPQQQPPQLYPQRYYHVRESTAPAPAPASSPSHPTAAPRRVQRPYPSPSSHSTPSSTTNTPPPPTPTSLTHPHPQQQQQQYTYYTEQTPRSRKPIHITTSKDSTSSGSGAPQPQPQPQPAHGAQSPPVKPTIPPMSPPQRRSRPSSPRPSASAVKYYPSNSFSPTRGDLPTSPPTRRTRGRLRSADSVSSLSSDMSSPQMPRAAARKLAEPCGSPSEAVRSPTLSSASSGQRQDNTKGIFVKPIVQIKYEEIKREPVNGPQSRKESSSSLDDEEIMRLVEKERKSTNLDDALSELEAIYKSLRLGDEDLLDRAERRDMPLYRPWGTGGEGQGQGHVAGTESDSGYNYHRSSSVEDDGVELRPRATPRRSGVPDKVADDMAYRRLKQAERPPSQQDSRSIVSQAGSYLLVSTALSPSQSPLGDNPRSTHSLSPEPDVTLDDVVYRTVRQANSTLKVAEHQPPFGIPLGPIAPSPNSDYLHATPQDRYRPTFKPRKTPDVVKDDLAFRNLRKDGQRDSAGLPPNPADSVPLHPAVDTPPPANNEALRKKRAVRSLSANIFNMFQRDRETENPEPEREKQDFEKAQSVADLAQVLQVAQKVQARKAGLRKRKEDDPNGDPDADPDATPRASSCYESSLRVADVTGTSTETLTDSRLNLEHQPAAAAASPAPARPTPSPRGIQTTRGRGDSSSPSKSSSAKEVDFSALDDLTQDSSKMDGNLDSLLTEMAKEARATSEKLGREIEVLVSEKSGSSPGPAPEARKRSRGSRSSLSSSPKGSPAPEPRARQAQGAPASRESVKSTHEAKNRLLKEQVLAQARCRSGSEHVDKLRDELEQEVEQPPVSQTHSSLDEMLALSAELPLPDVHAQSRSQQLSETARSQMESLQELTEMLSPSASRRATSTRSASDRSSADCSSAKESVSREVSVTKATPSPRRTISVSPRRSRSPGRSLGTPSRGTPSSLESGEELEDSLPPVSARVQMWNQRHHLRLTTRPPPANKVFNLPQLQPFATARRTEDDSSAGGSEGIKSTRTSATRSVTASPQLSSSDKLDESCDDVDVVDGPGPAAGLIPAVSISEESEVLDSTDGRLTESGSPEVFAEAESAPVQTHPEMDDVIPWRRRRASVSAEPAAPEPGAVRAEASTCTSTSVRATEAAPAPVPRESSDSSDRDDDDKEVAALLSNRRPPIQPPSPASAHGAPAPVAHPRDRSGSGPDCPAGAGEGVGQGLQAQGQGQILQGPCSLPCRSTSISPSSAPWYRDPESVLIACSYGLACAYQLADADFLTALGILLACLSLVAFMLIS